VSWQLSTARTEVLDDGRQRRYCRIIFAGCCSQPPPHRPMWSTFGSAVLDHGSFLFLKPLPGCPFVRRHVRETDNRIGLRFGPRPGADPPCTTRAIITLPRRHACQKSMRREMRSARPFTVNNNASTLGMGRRIMAERRRARTGRGRRWRAHARVKGDVPNDNGTDASLRAFVRALARQAARECFELELKQRSRTIQ
jgi:hypothetical protein